MGGRDRDREDEWLDWFVVLTIAIWILAVCISCLHTGAVIEAAPKEFWFTLEELGLAIMRDLHDIISWLADLLL